MATSTTVTSTINVPIYAAWKCSKCGELNFSKGHINCTVHSTSHAFTHKNRVEQASTESSLKVKAIWKEHALKIICDPANNYSGMRDCFYLANCKCQKCNHKEKWHSGFDLTNLAMLSAAPFLFSIMFVIGFPKTFWSWAFAILFGVLIVSGWIYEKCVKKAFRKIPRENMPIIGSMEPELRKYAVQNKKFIPEPEQALIIAASIENQEKFKFEQFFAQTPSPINTPSASSVNIASSDEPTNTDPDDEPFVYYPFLDPEE